MDPDLVLSVGLVLGVLSIPAILSALSEGRSPLAGGMALIAACGLVFLAWRTSPEGYGLRDLPHVLIEVIARYLI